MTRTVTVVPLGTKDRHTREEVCVLESEVEETEIFRNVILEEPH